MRKVAALLSVLSIALTGCSGSKKEAVEAKPLDPALYGRFYATAGPSESQSDLYEAQFHSEGRLFLFQLSSNGRTFGVDGCRSALTVDVAGRDVDFQDALRQFDSGNTVGIDGLPDPKGALMSVAPDCRVLFLRLDRTTTPPTGRLMMFDPATKNVRELHAGSSDRALGISDWGPDGRVAVFEGTQATEGHPSLATGIVVIAPDGSKRTVASPVSELGTLQWSASKLMAISDEVNRKTVFLDVDSGARSELPGWFPLAWSPDGKRLIVTDATSRKALGLVDVADVTKARVIGQTKDVSFVDLLWLPENARAGGGPPVPGRRPDEGN